MLYKVWESTPIQYSREDLTGTFVRNDFLLPGNPASRRCFETWQDDRGWGRYMCDFYGLWTDFRHEELTSNDGSATGSVSQVYFLASSTTAWDIILPHYCKMDGQTGEIVWIDRVLDNGNGTKGFANFLWSGNDYVVTDDLNRVWIHNIWGLSGGHFYRVSVWGHNANDKGGSVGMPKWAYYDEKIDDGALLNEAGTGPAQPGQSTGAVVKPVGLSERGNWYAVVYWGSDGRQVAVHDRTNGRRLGTIQLRNPFLRGVTIDSETVYVMTTRGTVEVLDIPRLNHLGVLAFGDFSWSGTVLSWVGVGYDRVSRRLLTLIRTPDDPDTGCATFSVDGWSLRELGERLTKPMPLEMPRDGKTVPVLGRVYGWTGKGIGGMEVTASIEEGDGSISPKRVSADTGGFVRYVWTQADPDLDTTTIRLSTDIVEAAPGISPPEYVQPTLSPPSSIAEEGREHLFFPGYWLYSPSYSRVRSATAEQAIDPYLQTYDDLEEDRQNNFRGVLVEYSWYELETALNNYDFSKISVDLEWAKSRGLKFMACLRSSNHAADGTAWIPDYIVNDTFGIYPESTTFPGHGVFVPQYSDLSLRGCMPLLTDANVKYRLTSLITNLTSSFQSDSEFVGLFPLDHPCRSPTPFSKAGVNLDSWFTARRDVLTLARSSIKLINEWVISSEESCDHVASSHNNWCGNNGVGVVSPRFLVDNYLGATRDASNALIDNVAKVATGVALPPPTWTSSHNLNCYGNQAVFRELVFGGANMVIESPSCSRRIVEEAKPWYVFVSPTPGMWDLGTDGMVSTVNDLKLTKDAKYYG